MKDFQVKRMFETIAFSYDFQNSFLSLRRDGYWRRALAQSIHAQGEALILDVATGTAEVAIQICRHRPQARVIGVDFSPKMLAIGLEKVRSRGLGHRIHPDYAGSTGFINNNHLLPQKRRDGFGNDAHDQIHPAPLGQTHDHLHRTSGKFFFGTEGLTAVNFSRQKGQKKP